MKKLISLAAIVALMGVPAFAQRGGQRGGGGQRPGFGQRGGGGQRGARQMRDPIAAAIDADGDGKLSAEEMAKAADRIKALDKDGDGVVDADELREALRASMFGGGGNARGGGRGGGGPGSPGSSTLERAGLELGKAAPDVTIYDDKGAKLRLADFKGKHTVIVFGCLT